MCMNGVGPARRTRSQSRKFGDLYWRGADDYNLDAVLRAKKQHYLDIKRWKQIRDSEIEHMSVENHLKYLDSFDEFDLTMRVESGKDILKIWGENLSASSCKKLDVLIKAEQEFLDKKFPNPGHEIDVVEVKEPFVIDENSIEEVDTENLTELEKLFLVLE